MFRRFLDPALRRSHAPSGAASFIAVLLAMVIHLAPVLAVAHEGHDDAPPPTVTSVLPRLAIKSESYEIVGVLGGDRLTIYLDRFEDNAPVTDATITVSIDGEQVAAEATPEGTYVVSSKLLTGRSSAELVFDIHAPALDDLLIGKLRLPDAAATTTGQSTDPSSSALAWSTLRHGVQDHAALLGLTLLVGLALGIGMRRRCVRTLPILMLATAALSLGSNRPASAQDEEQRNDGKAPTVLSDSARRMPDGKVFVPKATQRILDVRTAVAKSQTQPRAVVLVGRVITNPNRSGLVQSINGGRVIAPEQGLPRLGQAVAKGDVLARIEPAMPIADRTTISERTGELEQLITVTEAKLQRLRTLAERGAALQSLVVEAELELAGLRRRREVVGQTRIEPEVLRAPVDGVIAQSRVAAGQVVAAQDLLFQIVDPHSLWVEAYDYGGDDPAALKRAMATASGLEPMKLGFQGWGRMLQQQATVVQFAITDPPAAIRVGQPVTVTAQRGDMVTGLIVDRDAIVRDDNGETVVWCHVEPEQFEARPVRWAPVDATHVLIAAGVAEGERIVVRGAELINQIH
jgi:cobalt-zinc-cadmium efflux system membrane fusion protein